MKFKNGKKGMIFIFLENDTPKGTLQYHQVWHLRFKTQNKRKQGVPIVWNIFRKTIKSPKSGELEIVAQILTKN